MAEATHLLGLPKKHKLNQKDLADVEVSNPQNGQALLYESASGNWKNQALPGGGDMLKSTYDIDEDGVVDNSEKLENSTKAQVQDHDPKAHTLDSHSEKKLDMLDEKTLDVGVTVDGCLIKDGKAADSNLLEGSNKATVQDHTPKAHTLASHSTKDHNELTGVTSDQHHAQSHSLASHSGSGTVKTTLSFAVTGTLTTGNDKAPTIVAPCTLTITKVKLVVKTAPTGADLIVDVNKAGTTIFTTQANRPKITVGNTQGDSGAPDVTSLSEGDKITIDIDQVGSTVAGADLTVEVVCEQTVVFS